MKDLLAQLRATAGVVRAVATELRREGDLARAADLEHALASLEGLHAALHRLPGPEQIRALSDDLAYVLCAMESSEPRAPELENLTRAAATRVKGWTRG